MQCHDPKRADYKYYGWRGIQVCQRWRASYEAFLEDMGRRPEWAQTIDRIDNDKGYSCGKCDDCRSRRAKPNCRWATRHEQARNKRNNRLISFNGLAKTTAEWAELTGIPRTAIDTRLTRGWSVEQALTAPVYSRRIAA